MALVGVRRVSGPSSIPGFGHGPQTMGRATIAQSLGSGNVSASATTIAATPNAAAIGDLVIVAFTWAIVSGTINTCTDTSGNSWTIVNTPAAVSQSGGYAYTTVTTGWANGANTVTATLNTTGGGRCWCAAGIPAAYSAVFDQHNEATATGSISIATASPLAQANETLFMIVLVRATGTTTIPVFQFTSNFQAISSATGSGTLDAGVAIGAYDNLSGTPVITGTMISATQTDPEGVGIIGFTVTYPGTGPVTQNLAVNFSQGTSLAPINQVQKPIALTAATTVAVTKQPQKPIALTEMVSLQNQSVSVDAAIHGSGLTFTHTTSGTDRYLIVGVTGATQDTSTGVTYAGAAMTLLNRSVGVTNTLTTEIWGLVNPALNANSVVITRSGTNLTPDQGAISFNNVNQGDPVGQSGGNNGGATSPSLTLKSPVVVAPPGGMLVDMTACENPITNNLGTSKWTASPAFGGDGQAILAATGDSQPQFTTWTQGSNQVWTMSIVVLKPSMAPVKQARKVIAISEAATLSLVKSITKTVALTQATTLTILKTLVKLITIPLTQVTTLTVTKRISKPIALTQASAIVNTKLASKGISLAQATTLTAAKAVSKTIALTEAATLALTKRISKTVPLTQTTALSAVVGSLKRLTVAVSQATALAVTKTAQKSIALSEATTIAVKKTANKSVGLSQATALALTKKVSSTFPISQATSLTVTKLAKKTLALTQATALVASAVKGATLKTLSVALTQASALTVKKTVAKPIALTEAATLALTKRCSSTFALAQASTLGITKLVSHRISVIQATSLSAAFSATRRLSAAFSQATSLVIHKTTSKSVSVAQNTSVAATKSISKTVTIAQATTVTTTKSIARRIALSAGTAFSAAVSFVSKLRGGSAVSSDSAVWVSAASDALANVALPTDSLAAKAVTGETASGITISDSPIGNAGISDSL